MTISSKLMHQLLAGDPVRSESALSRFLESDAWQLDDLAELGVQLVPRSHFALATQVFAKWTEVTPNNPEPWTNLGLCLSRQKRLQEARSVLEHALEINPNYLPAMNNLGEVYQELGEHDLQMKNCLQAVSKHPNSALAFNNLGSAFVELAMFGEAKQAFNKCLLLDPSSFEARFNLAKIASRTGDSQLALEYLETAKAQNASKNQRQADMLDLQLGIEYLICGRLKEGWALYEKGFSSAIPASLARGPQRQFSVPLWDGRSLAPGERLMIWREQGVGDEIRFAALIPLLPQSVRNNLVLECDHRLVNLISRSMPEVRVRAESQSMSDFDYHLPIGSLPRLLMKSVDVLRDAPPLLTPDPKDVAKFAGRLAEFRGKKLVGICWRSHKLSATRNKKYTALEDWCSILSIPGAVFVNLQYGECEEEIQQIERELGIRILRWADLDLMHDFSGVAALIANLDLVVSISSAVVPLAGAVSAQTLCMTYQNWVLLGEKNVYPWFPSVMPIAVPYSEPIVTALPIPEQRVRELVSR
ncbi:MAG: tetratricopeptide repeat protein [Betaproteobacteria bacterium]|nr:tetratricopeptide repeat protein [Betaproteobacteria bacterium]